MSTLDRLRSLAPWNNVSEEDFFLVDNLWISIRGLIRLPQGAYFCSTEDDARRLVFQPDDPVAPGVWTPDSKSGVFQGTDQAKADRALEQVLDQFEGKPAPGVKFPICFNLEQG